MRVSTGTLSQAYTPWDGVAGFTVHAPGLGTCHPGQYVLCATRNPYRQILPSVCLPTAQNAADDTFDFLLPAGSEAQAWTIQAGLDRSLSVTGPLGHAFVVEKRTRRALLVDSGWAQAPLLPLVLGLVDAGIEVTYATGRIPVSAPVPARALPPEIEYLQMSDDGSGGDRSLLATLTDLALWPDAVFIAADMPLVHAITAVLRRRLMRLRKGFAQVLLMPQLLPCGTGACDLCTIDTREGRKRLCRDGLVFDLLSLS